MGLREVIQAEAAAAIAAMGNLAVTATYRFYTTERDPATRKAVRTPHNSSIKCVMTKFQTREIEAAGGLVPSTDTKILIPRQGLEFEILAGNEIIIYGTTHAIIDVKTDPAGALYVVQGRR